MSYVMYETILCKKKFNVILSCLFFETGESA